jgi:hypothetical protein
MLQHHRSSERHRTIPLFRAQDEHDEISRAALRMKATNVGACHAPRGIDAVINMLLLPYGGEIVFEA